MTEQVSAKEIHVMLGRYLHDRPDLGISKAIPARILEPRNPFAPKSPRKPKRWFVLLLLTASASVVVFAYFNFWH